MTYDYIITGAGCAGLSLAVRMIQSEGFKGKRILLADQSFRIANDRTWCFWETEDGFFEPVVHCRWKSIQFHGVGFSSDLKVGPYQYKMIRSIDFYQWCMKIIRESGQVELLTGNIDKVYSDGLTATAIINNRTYSARYVFNSVLFEVPTGDLYYFLKQHFKGWFIKTGKPIFDQSVATLMDFRTSQKHGTTFVYTLPLSPDRALVEYTLFTKDLLAPEEYDEALKLHIQEHITKEDYTIEETEFGVIPMTNYPFRQSDGNVINIGTAGGQTKPSTGYTFQFIQKYSQQIVDSLLATGKPPTDDGLSRRRFHFYDSTLLHILDKGNLSGAQIFTDLFKNGDAAMVFKFLDNDTSPFEDLNIMNRLPKLPFAVAAFRELLKI